MNAEQVKKMAARFGADLVGIAPAEKFRNLPARENPFSIFPQFKSMIVLGSRIPRGTLRNLECEGRDLYKSFEQFGLYMVEDQFLAKSTYDTVIWIEAQGFEAVPLFGYDAEAAAKCELAVPVAEGKPAANVYVNYKKAAELAGLGRIGKNGLFITPQFGTLQRFAMLLCDKELEADPVPQFDFCSGCDECVKACKLDALDEKGNFRTNRCSEGGCGAVQCNWGRFNTIDRIGASCGRACLASLEKRGLITKRFNSAFRSED